MLILTAVVTLLTVHAELTEHQKAVINENFEHFNLVLQGSHVCHII